MPSVHHIAICNHMNWKYSLTVRYLSGTNRHPKDGLLKWIVDPTLQTSIDFKSDSTLQDALHSINRLSVKHSDVFNFSNRLKRTKQVEFILTDDYLSAIDREIEKYQIASGATNEKVSLLRETTFMSNLGFYTHLLEDEASPIYSTSSTRCTGLKGWYCLVCTSPQRRKSFEAQKTINKNTEE